MTDGRSIRAAFFDIDGTLVSYHTHRMPQSTIDALHAMRARGIRVLPATGRAQFNLGFLSEWFDFDDRIAVNGQLAYAGGEQVRNAPIVPEDIHALVDLVRARRFPCLFVEADRMYLSSINDTARAHFALVGQQPPPVRALDEGLSMGDIYQFVTYTDAEGDAAVQAALPHVKALRAAPMCLDYIPSDGGKPIGMQAVMARYGIRREETIAFGDGTNDVDMLAYAGIGVAMGNAEPEVKAVADYVTASVDEDGIAEAVRRFVLTA